jgi:hypothetical protein
MITSVGLVLCFLNSLRLRNVLIPIANKKSIKPKKDMGLFLKFLGDFIYVDIIAKVLLEV